MSSTTDVAVIGAGPYGLSIAAHLRALGVEHRIVGRPMQTWLTQMPKGMSLKSEGFASNLSDREGRYTLGHYCAEQGIEYADVGLPVALETFSAYGLAFQRRHVSYLENKMLISVDRCAQGFMLTLDDGETFTARRVVMAIGISYFAQLPRELAHLPREYVTHSSDQPEPERFKGRKVVVVGAGASAVDLAALLHEAGADVQLVARRPQLEIHTQMQLPRPLLDRIKAPLTGIGPSWRSWWYCNTPVLFHLLPEETRLRIVKNHLGPAAGYFMRDRFIGKVPTILGYRPQGADAENGHMKLHLVANDGSRRRVETEHVICATGYRVDLRRVTPLTESLRSQIKAVDYTPVLTSHFQASVPGLFFVGPPAGNSFGPLMRFAFGADYTARRVANYLARTAVRHRRITTMPLSQPTSTIAGVGDD